MLRFKITDDKQFIQLTDFSLNSERAALFKHFKKKSKAANFNSLVDRGIWDGMDPFITKDGKIAVGLWKEIYKFAKVHEFDCEIEGADRLIDNNITQEKYLKFVDKLLDGVVDEFGMQIVPRDYQVEGAFRALKYRFCTEELATSAGKTLLFYIFNSALKFANVINPNRKALLIVPNVDLVDQTAKKFIMYSNGIVKWNILTIGGDDSFDQKKFDECDMVISTYQSLINLEPKILEKQLVSLFTKRVKKGEEKRRETTIANVKEKIKYFTENPIFDKFSVVNIDETHKSRGASIRDILLACTSWKYRLGLSGTVKIDEKYSDFFRMQENVGPLVMMLSAKYLQDNGFSPHVRIKQVYLKYNNEDPYLKEYWRLKEEGKEMYNNMKDFGRDMLNIEKTYIYNSLERLQFISDFTKSLNKNTLILFSDVKNGYGQRICDQIKKWNEKTYYIAGEIDNSHRQEYKEIMEKNEGVIIVASFGTFSTGIDLKNVHHIIFAESTKAEITIRQSIGRGMRKFEEKEKVFIWDLIDDLAGYSVKHSKLREEIYIDQQFHVSKVKVDLTKVVISQ